MSCVPVSMVTLTGVSTSSMVLSLCCSKSCRRIWSVRGGQETGGLTRPPLVDSHGECFVDPEFAEEIINTGSVQELCYSMGNEMEEAVK